MAQICPKCITRNSDDAVKCEKCKTSLANDSKDDNQGSILEDIVDVLADVVGSTDLD